MLLNKESWIASYSRSLQWERGLKFIKQKISHILTDRRSLQWERGLKYYFYSQQRAWSRVVPCNGNVD